MAAEKEVAKIEIEVEGNIEKKRELDNDNQFQYQDFFNFEDKRDWSANGLKPETCVSTSHTDYIVFSMYRKNHNQCSGKKMGTYRTDIGSFIKAYVRHMEKMKNMYGIEYEEPDDDALMYLNCQAAYNNNRLFYLKIGCKQGYGSGFQLHAYTDSTCTTKATQAYYNQDIDLQNLNVGFGRCNSCEKQTYGYNNNGNNNNGNNNNYYYGYNNNNNNNNGNNNNNYGYNSQYSHKSPLCSAAFHYRKSCFIGCRIAARKAESSNAYSYNYNRNNGGGNNNMNNSNYNAYGGYDDGFSSVGVVALWVLSVTGALFLFKGLSQRRKLSKSTLASEEAGVRSVGLNMAWIPCILISLAILLITFILLEMKILTWFLIVALNIAFLAYWIHTIKKARNEENENGYVSSDKVHVNNGNGPDTTSISTKRTVSSKMIYA